MNEPLRLRFLLAVLLAVAVVRPAQAQSSNMSPEISILWPVTDCAYNYRFRSGTVIKIKANATDSDGSIAGVQFFADTNLIGVVSNPPYSLVWTSSFGATTPPQLKAVAVDNLGATSESTPIGLYIIGGLNLPPVLGIISPSNGSIFAAPGTFVFSAELLASLSGTMDAAEFFVGTNSVGIVTQAGPLTATAPPYVLTVTNVPEGDYTLHIKYGGLDHFGGCQPTVIHVTKLGMQSPRLMPDNRFQFDVVTSFPTNQNVIQSSSNLLNWSSISTNMPGTNSFTYTEPLPATNSPRFYRVVVPAP